MKTPRLFQVLPILPLAAVALHAGAKFTVTVTNDLAIARPAEVITLPWAEVASRLPDTLPSHILVKDATGAVIPDQLLNFKPEEHHDNYLSLIFQHDFAAGEHTAVFTVEATEAPVPPFPSKVAARYVPERFDDFAWENDRIAHRVYGPGLDTPAAGKSQMISSGIDVWSKRVRYLTNDRFYLMGHYHDDNGDGLDMYDVGTARGDGGTGIWDGRTLHVSQNWTTWKVLANGPIRAVFELTYGPWDGGGVLVSETKRFTVDAGHNLDAVESTFTFANASDELTVAIGLGKHAKAVSSLLTKDAGGRWMTAWENYPKNGSIGCGVLLAPGLTADYAEEATDWLMLTKVKSGVPLDYHIGACWSRSGDFTSKDAWSFYLVDCAERTQSPVTVSFGPAQ